MTEPLSVLERRVLGVLVEKALTAAAPEPLTLNAVVVGSNQKSNRDPLMSVEEPEVDDALERLQRKGLVFRITGGRAERWRHNLYDAWQVSKAELALLAELLLRGPQTAAEARSRASRMEPLDQETATSCIKALAGRGFIVWLAPENRRGAMVTHGFHPPDELTRLTTAHSTGLSMDEVRPPTPAVPAGQALETRLNEALGEMIRLRADVEQLRASVAALQEALGVIPPQPS
jgi:uncharacterized protein YceH (UPF0502 family)